MTGDYPAAAASHQQALDLYHDLGDQAGQASALSQLGWVEMRPGTTRPPPPATSKPSTCTATWITLGARPWP